MKTFHIDAQADHVLRLSRRSDPLGALVELIWNALDAEANTIEVEVLTNHGGGLDGVIVRDDGHGMPNETCAAYFQNLGGSWKAGAHVSPELSRPLHGKNGQGRLRSFAIGESVTWTTVSAGLAGREKTTISVEAARPTQGTISAPVVVTDPAGTEVRTRIPTKYADRINSEKTFTQLAAEFSPFLTANPGVTIKFRGAVVDPKAAQIAANDYPLAIDEIGSQRPPLLRVIEWSRDPGREIALCDSLGTTLASAPPNIHAPGHFFTAYVMWDGFEEHRDYLALADLSSSVVATVLEAARDRLRAHFREREQARRARQVEEWKAEKVYPYEDDPEDATATAERDLFDFVATTIGRKLPKAAGPKRHTLRLLREVVSTSPGRLPSVLDEMFSLTHREVTDFANLLDRTSLSNLIAANTDIANKLDFLASLRLMVFDPEINKKVKERKELHKILERETWIFGDQFALLLSDQSLNEVLARHLQKLGKNRSSLTPVRRADGRTGIVDLMLSRFRRDSHLREHLVVELKAPKVKLGSNEVAQIKSYAQVVADDPQFKDVNVSWDFWLIGSEMDEVASRDARQENKPPGLIADWGGNVRIWAKTWSQIIDDCEIRLRYYKEALNHDPTTAHVQEYLSREHGNLAKAALADEQSA